MWQGVLLGLLSAACWACANVAIKGVSQRLGSWSAMVWAQLIGGGIVTVIALLTLGLPRGLDARTWAWIGLSGVSAAVAYAGLFTSLSRGRVAVVTPVISSWALPSVLIGVMLMGERLTAWGGAGVAAVIAGNVAIATSSTGEGQEAQKDRGALWWALMAACGFGVMMPAVHTVGARVGRLWTVPLVWAVELALVIPLLWWRGELARRPRGAMLWWITVRTALFEVGGFVAVSFALGIAPVAVVSPLSSLATAGSVLLGLLLLRERPGWRVLVGATIASLGVVLVNLR